jgi:hypothetical protein
MWHLTVPCCRCPVEEREKADGRCPDENEDYATTMEMDKTGTFNIEIRVLGERSPHSLWTLLPSPTPVARAVHTSYS